MKKYILGLILGMVLSFLLLFPAQALSASRNGLSLWFDTLLPTLLPFCILSNLLIRSGMVRPLTALLSPLTRRLFGLSANGTYALFMGFFCGCPMGAKTLNDLMERHQISRTEANYLLSFCNNLSPTFLMTFLVTEQLKQPTLALPILALLYGSPLLFAMITNPFYRRKKKHLPDSSLLSDSVEPLSFALADACILDGVLTLVKLGGYLILFSILSAIFAALPIPTPLCALLTGICEITGGIPAILTSFSFPADLLLLMPLCAFGGLSALAQTDSVTKNAHLSMGKYVRSKCLISLIAFLLSLVLVVILYGSSGIAGW
jgi:sporulation integral membrane protein YlbJ